MKKIKIAKDINKILIDNLKIGEVLDSDADDYGSCEKIAYLNLIETAIKLIKDIKKEQSYLKKYLKIDQKESE